MSRIRRNIVANTLGRGWSMFLGVAILPLYVRFLGAEAYGLVGLYATLAVICSLFDVGISASLGRELARAGVGKEAGKQSAELVRTAELLYGGIGLLLGAVIALGAPFIVTKWLNLKDLNVVEATHAVQLMGLYLVFQWPTGLYLGALAGLQRQVDLNVINAAGSSLRAIGSIVVLWKVSPDIVSFYRWQVLATALYMLASREAVWRALRNGRREAAFRWRIVGQVRGFAAGVTLLSLVSVSSSQLDKVVLTKLVPLESFGYYSFATSIAAAATFFGQPVLTATYPAMIEAFTLRDVARLAGLFHRSSQLVALVIFAPAAVLCAFAPVVLRLWVRDPATAANSSGLVSVCLIGAALNGTLLMPYNLTMAAGRVRPAMIAAGSGVLVYGATLAILALRLGVMAGAVGGALVSVAGVLIYARFAVSPLLPDHGWRWLTTDIVVPLSTAAIVAAVIRAMTLSQTSLHGQIAALLLASLATLISTAAVTPTVREELVVRIQALRSKRLT